MSEIVLLNSKLKRWQDAVRSRWTPGRWRTDMNEGMRLVEGNPDAWSKLAGDWRSAVVGAAEGFLALSLAAACARGVNRQQPEAIPDGVLNFFVLSPDQEKRLIDNLNINGIAMEDGRVLKPIDVFRVSETYPVEGSINGENYTGVTVTQLDLDPAGDDELVELYTFTDGQTPVGTMWAWWESNGNGEAQALKLGIGSDGIAKIQIDQNGNPIIIGRAKIENGQTIRSFDFNSDGTDQLTLIDAARSAIEKLLSAHAGVAAAEEDVPIPPSSPTIQATWTPDGRLTAIYTPSPEPAASPTATERPFLKPEWLNPPDLDSVSRIAVAGRKVPFGVLDPDNPVEFPFPPERNISRYVQNMRKNGVRLIFLSAVVVAGENGEMFFRDEQGLMFINLALPMFDGDGRLTGWQVAHPPVASFCVSTDPLSIRDADVNTPTVDIYANQPTRLGNELGLLTNRQVIVDVIEPKSPLGCPDFHAYQDKDEFLNTWLKNTETVEGKIGTTTVMYTE